ncbi:hypothetical protein CWI36_0906p0020, partial [Hamiltosporidium magnivora]
MLKWLRIFFTIQLSIFNLYMTINSVYLCAFYEDKEYDKSMLLDHLSCETDTHSNPSINNKNLMDESYMEFNKDIMEKYFENQDTVSENASKESYDNKNDTGESISDLLTDNSIDRCYIEHYDSIIETDRENQGTDSENALKEEYNSETKTGESISDLLTDKSMNESYIEHYDPIIETDRETHIENQDTRYKNVSKEGYNNENDTGKSISELSTDSIKSEILDQIYPESNLSSDISDERKR